MVESGAVGEEANDYAEPHSRNFIGLSRSKPETSSRPLASQVENDVTDERRHEFFANPFIDDTEEAATVGKRQEDEGACATETQETAEERFVKEFLGTEHFEFIL